MGQFQATVRILDVSEPDAPAARRTVEERLQKSGFRRWQLVYLGEQSTRAVQRYSRRSAAAHAGFSGGGMLLAAILSWTLWILWLIES